MYYKPARKEKNKAKLDSGEIVEYDACSSKGHRYGYDSKKFKYIGKGVIFYVEGFEQSFTEKMYFFVKRERN